MNVTRIIRKSYVVQSTNHQAAQCVSSTFLPLLLQSALPQWMVSSRQMALLPRTCSTNATSGLSTSFSRRWGIRGRTASWSSNFARVPGSGGDNSWDCRSREGESAEQTQRMQSGILKRDLWVDVDLRKRNLLWRERETYAWPVVSTSTRKCDQRV